MKKGKKSIYMDLFNKEKKKIVGPNHGHIGTNYHQ